MGSVHAAAGGGGGGEMNARNSGIEDAECQARLEAFLAASPNAPGGTPIFVGFGSCEPNAEELCSLVDTIVVAAAEADVRIVFQFNALDMWYVKTLVAGTQVVLF